MNNRFVITIIALFVCIHLTGQRRADKVEALRAAFISRHVSLSESESESFWPVYNEYHDKLRSVRRNIVRLHLSYAETMDEEEVSAMAAKEIELRKTEKEIHVYYSNRIVSLIGQRKYMRVRVAEERFRKEMLKIVRDD